MNCVCSRAPPLAHVSEALLQKLILDNRRIAPFISYYIPKNDPENEKKLQCISVMWIYEVNFASCLIIEYLLLAIRLPIQFVQFRFHLINLCLLA
jgi:hypothetical protein